MQWHDVIDVFNGDADGLVARHQYRLMHPVAPEQVTLVSGVKRDIALLDRVPVTGAARRRDIQVFDISYDRNATAAATLLEDGARITYVDHHRADHLTPHPRLVAYIDESPDVCSSLLVDRLCGGKYRLWAIAAAFGDNLTAVGNRLSQEAGLSTAEAAQLSLLGECLNYNAYGESIEDLHYPPLQLAARLAPYSSPLDFIAREDVLSRLKAGFDADLANALAVRPQHASDTVAVYMLPDQAWARRVSGALANRLVHDWPARAHAVMTADARGLATVSIRAPLSSPRDASRVALQFANSGGRAAAAGIESFSPGELPRLIEVLEETYR
ncbi:MAG: acetyltransferase [Betaproteobacteria bacterium]